MMIQLPWNFGIWKKKITKKQGDDEMGYIGSIHESKKE